MNTRLQVEHPVTEEVLGVDLVKAQILTAQGQPVFTDSARFQPRGHSIECRVYAENPYMSGVPSTGLLGKIHWPEGPRRRFEYGFEEGDEITPFYDPMIAKVIVWDENRPRAIQKMIQVLRESVVFGVHTNIPYLIEILSHPEFVKGTMTTRFIDKYFSEGIGDLELTAQEKQFAEKAAQVISQKNNSVSSQGLQFDNPFASYWRGI